MRSSAEGYPIVDSDFHFQEIQREARIVGAERGFDFSSNAAIVWIDTLTVTYHERAMEALSWGRLHGIDGPAMVLEDGSVVPASWELTPTDDGKDFRCTIRPQ